MESLSTANVDTLHRLRNRFDGAAAAHRAELLATCAACRLGNARLVRRYHETLLFMAAYPDGRRTAALVAAELERIDAAAPNLLRSQLGRELLASSGLAGGVIEANFSIALIEWLVRRFPGQVELAWEDGVVGTALGDLLALALLAPERDGRLHTRFDMQRWVRLAAAADAGDPRDLRWVLDRLRELLPDGELRDLVAESVDLRVRWRLTSPEATRTHARFPARPEFLQTGALRRTFDAARLLKRSLPDPVRLSRSATRDLIDVARCVLSVRAREADPVTHANEREVTLFRLERGIDVALFGLEPRRRLPIESYFGYIAARNRVPIAYGGGWVMDRRAEIGVHLFETFRGGESAYAFAQLLRTYRQHYGITRFQVDPYQFGADNADAIRSGAFWFYHRLGFRPLDATLRALAEREWRSIRADTTHRTSAAVLRRFTESPLVLDLGEREPASERPDPTQLGVAVMTRTRARFGDDRTAASRWAMRRVKRLLPSAGGRPLSDDERLARERLAPLMAFLPGLEAWPASDRRALAAIMRAKGGARERDYVQRIQRHARLRAALVELQASVDWASLPGESP